MTSNQWSAAGGEALQEAHGRSGNQKAADQRSEKPRVSSEGWTDGMYQSRSGARQEQGIFRADWRKFIEHSILVSMPIE